MIEDMPHNPRGLMDQLQLPWTPQLHNSSLALDHLPFDIKDDIISSVDASSDLLRLALASKEWTSMVIPNHIEYRELKVRVDCHVGIWKHLAARANLAKNIRSVHLLTQRTNIREQFPSTLGEETKADLESPPAEGPTPEMLTALSNFKSLQRFTWMGNKGSPMIPNSVFNILVGCQDLQEVKLWQVSPDRDQLTTASSVCRY
ncbi:hypothetical protein M413DRAFT_349826 [Hebeloma cylindrosporum]|uniref:F-box domain-containing protein n=1 Tax=Hebeloma cylindrosporum TaxID=76867 RepID=A0A0C3BVI3_HEBCY|nr:hypothetical protein M413DRAFT_349826 [Hebeloma cylindrosporum h7]